MPPRRRAQAEPDLSAIQMSAFGGRLAFASSWLQARGFFSDNSLTGASLRADPRPLLTWPFLDFLATLDLSRVDLVELGAGFSTLALARRFRAVRSFENDRAWAERLRGALPENVTLEVFAGPTLKLSQVPLKPEHWLLVDFAGRRTRFVKQLVTKLKKAALPVAVVLDNSDWYRRGAALLAAAGYTEIPFFGLKSGQTWVSCTSFFFLPRRLRLELNRPFALPPFARRLVPSWDVP